MKIFISTAVAILVAALFITPARAQFIEKKSVNLEGANKAIAAAIDYAKKNNAPGGVIAVVDEGGNQRRLDRIEGTLPMARPSPSARALTPSFSRNQQRVS